MWSVEIHKSVWNEDFKNISLDQQRKILSTIEKKLTLAPEEFGKPLTGEFFGYWRLRIGDYRVVYKIDKGRIVVLVIKIGMRKDDKIYKELFTRLRKIS